jgi:hypothetical protein
VSNHGDKEAKKEKGPSTPSTKAAPTRFASAAQSVTTPRKTAPGQDSPPHESPSQSSAAHQIPSAHQGSPLLTASG